jgi:hypothetical protein
MAKIDYKFNAKLSNIPFCEDESLYKVSLLWIGQIIPPLEEINQKIFKAACLGV